MITSNKYGYVFIHISAVQRWCAHNEHPYLKGNTFGTKVGFGCDIDDDNVRLG